MYEGLWQYQYIEKYLLKEEGRQKKKKKEDTDTTRDLLGVIGTR